MTGICHETTEAVTVAAAWIASNRHDLPNPIIPHLRQTFGLTPAEACEALAEARRADHGRS